MELGKRFNKPDIERVGIFSELPYKPETVPKKKPPQNEPQGMYCEGAKSKTGTQHGYFDDKFRRIFSKEAVQKKRKPPEVITNSAGVTYMPPGGQKSHSTPGDYYGCFSGNISAFSRIEKKAIPRPPVGPNFYTSPGKKGGPGYPKIGLNPFPEYKPDRYGSKANYKQYGAVLNGPMVTAHYPRSYFDDNPYKGSGDGPTYVRPKEKLSPALPPGVIIPAGRPKMQGGCHAGCFSPFPAYISDKYTKPKPPPEKNVFVPQSRALKTYYSTSILHQAVDRRVNRQNYETSTKNYTKYLL